ncbi:MAG: flagellar hook-basal body complex protein, partial [Rhodocyclaceae bacterium]|nr:flagellar hook-basal body complex protein [Rhodocyclaceae bacterium]
NGKRVAIGQVALANFDNPYDLARVGDNLFMETYGSGQPSIGKPMTGMFGTIKANYTEDSNVDLTKELVNLIVFQRNYQANAQSIRTQDTILQTVVNLR